MEHPFIYLNLVVQNYLMSWFAAGYIFHLSPEKKHVQFGLLGGLLVYVTRGIIRLSGLPIGINTVITLVFSIPVYKVTFKISNWKEPALISIFGYMMIAFVEILTLGLTLDLFNATPDMLLTNSSIHNKFLIIENICILIFILLFKIIHRSISEWKWTKNGHR